MAIFIILGSIIEGPKCMDTIKDIASLDLDSALKISFSAAVAVAFMTVIGLPASTSQAIIGSLVGASLATGMAPPEWSKLGKILICWVFTPIGAALFSFILYHVFAKFFNRFVKSDITFDATIKWLLIITGCYGSYTLGANNVANATGVYYNSGVLDVNQACSIGGVSIAFGVITYSYRVMQTVGEKITNLGPLGAYIAVLANAVTIHLFTQIGVPVSSSQAVVGAVVGIGMVKGGNTISRKILLEIFLGWTSTPLLSGVVTYAVMLVC
jgi:PiT family inorganic phosphate transporter